MNSNYQQQLAKLRRENKVLRSNQGQRQFNNGNRGVSNALLKHPNEILKSIAPEKPKLKVQNFRQVSARKQKKARKRDLKRQEKLELRKFVKVLIERADKPALSGSAYEVGVNQDAVTLFITSYMTHLAMKTSIFVNNNSNDATWVYPQDMAAYLFTLFLMYIKECGHLNGTMQQNLPQCADFMVPIPFAKWLQGFGCYSEVGYCLSSAYSFNSNYTMGINYPDHNSNFPFSALLDGPSRKIGMLMVPTTGTFEYYIAADAVGPVHTDFNTFLQDGTTLQLSKMLCDVVPCINLCDLIEHGYNAPNGSAYGVPQTGIPSIQIENRFHSSVCSFDPEECMLYVGTTSMAAESGTYDPSNAYCYPVITNVDTNAINTCPQEMFINCFIRCWWTTAIMGYKAILKSTYYEGAKLTTLRYCSFNMNGSVAVDAAASAYRKVFLSQRNNTVANIVDASVPPVFITDTTIPADSSYRVLSALLAAVSMVTLRRYIDNAIHFQCFDNYSMPQQYYTDNLWGSMMLPAAVASCIQDFAPAVHCGMLFVPTFTPILTYTIGGTATNAPYTTAAGFPGNSTTNLFNCVYGNPYYGIGTADPSTSSGIMLNGTTASAQAALSNVVNNRTAAAQATYGINLLAHALLNYVNTLWSSFTSPATFTDQLVHQHHTPFGAIGTILSYWVTSYPVSAFDYVLPKYIFAQHGVNGMNSTFIVKAAYNLIKYHSIVQQSHHQMMRAMIAPWRTTQFATRSSRFVRKLDTPFNSDHALDAINDVTFAFDSSFSKSLVIEEQKSQPRQMIAGPITFMIRHGNCWWTDLFNEALTALSPLINKGIYAAGQQACGPACGTIGVMAYNWIRSNLNTKASDIKKPIFTKEGKGDKQVIDAISKIKEMPPD